MYTYLKTENAEGIALARRPKTQIDAQATYYVNDSFDLGLNAQYIGERYNKDDNQGAQTGKYTISNFVANYKILGTKTLDSVALYGKINNLTDKYYQSVDGYASAGRSYYAGINIQY